MTEVPGQNGDTAGQQRLLESERARLARELHDSLAPALWYYTQLAEQVRAQVQEGEPAEAALGELAAGLTTLYDTVRAELEWLAPDLRSQSLSSFAASLAPALQGLANLSGFALTLHVGGDDVTLPPLVQHHLSRILREAVWNALRHSGGDAVEVRLSAEAGTLTAQVEDNGRGLSARELETARRGLEYMRTRAQEMGGSTTVSAREGQGTRVTVQIPLEHSKG